MGYSPWGWRRVRHNLATKRTHARPTLKKKGRPLAQQNRPETSAGEHQLQGCFALQRWLVLRCPGTP